MAVSCGLPFAARDAQTFNESPSTTLRSSLVVKGILKGVAISSRFAPPNAS
jgi:hypothetical protein